MVLTHANNTFGRYDFGLSPEEEKRALRLLAESVVVDMMFGGPCGYRSFTREMEDHVRTVWDARHDPYETVFACLRYPVRLAARGELPAFKEQWDASGITAGSRPMPVGSYEPLVRSCSVYLAAFDRLPWLTKALSASDIRRAKIEGKHAGFFYCQPHTSLSPDLGILDLAYDMGLRMLQLTYNKMDFVGSGCTERTDGGLSSYGLRVVTRLNELGIIVDTSHCGPRTTLDACRFSTRPVMACHTSAADLFYHARAKSDEEIKAIAATDGVIGVYAVPFFLAPAGQGTIETMLDHVRYIADLVGWRHVGIGTDWPMQMPKWLVSIALKPLLLESGFRESDIADLNCDNLVGFDDYRDFPNIVRGLVKHRFSDEQIQGVLGENFLRVFELVCG